MRPPQLYSSGLLLGVAVGAGCFYSLSSDHCYNNGGDQACDGGRFCSNCRPQGDGCVDVRPSPECHFEGGEPNEPSSTSGIESMTGEPTMPSDPHESSTGTVPCESHGDCTDEASPFCEPTRRECVACDEMGAPHGECAARDPEAPLCVAGRCVQCTNENLTACDDGMVCDEGSHACVLCTEHEQCSSGACELAVGRCFPTGTPVWEAYTENDIFAALSTVEPGKHGIIIVHGGDYQSSIHITANKTIALLAAPGELPRVHGNGLAINDFPGLHVTGADTALYVDGLEISYLLHARMGVVVDDGLAWFDRSRIVMNGGGGIVAENDAELTLRNCFVGGDVEGVHALAVDGAHATVVYTTLGAGDDSPMGAVAGALTCTNQAAVEVRNSLLVARTNTQEVDCPNIIIEHSAAEQNLGGTNVALGSMLESWFVAYPAGDLHLSGTHPTELRGVARWRADDPRIDIDGEVRPAGPGDLDHAGADRF